MELAENDAEGVFRPSNVNNIDVYIFLALFYKLTAICLNKIIIGDLKIKVTQLLYNLNCSIVTLLSQPLIL